MKFWFYAYLWIFTFQWYLFFVFQGLTPSSLVSIDVAKLFRGIETLFPIVIDSLYSGVQVVSPQDVTNSLLNSVYNTLELQVCCKTFNEN